MNTHSKAPGRSQRRGFRWHHVILTARFHLGLLLRGALRIFIRDLLVGTRENRLHKNQEKGQGAQCCVGVFIARLPPILRLKTGVGLTL